MSHSPLVSEPSPVVLSAPDAPRPYTLHVVKHIIIYVYMMSSRSRTTRIRILKSAQRLLVERGYHGVGLEEIARAAGVSRQAIYLHFKSKVDLLVAMAQQGDEAVGIPDILQPVREAKTALEALDAGVAAYAA